MRINKFDFDTIEQIILAAKNLQWANKSEDCERVMADLGRSILGLPTLGETK